MGVIWKVVEAPSAEVVEAPSGQKLELALKTISFSAAMYEVESLEIECQNPFTIDAEFEILLEGIAFHTASKVVKVKAQGAAKLTVTFLPLDAREYFLGHLRFADAKAGEFFYDLCGTACLPIPLETYMISSQSGFIGVRELIVPHGNVQRDRARMYLKSRGVTDMQPLADTVQYDVELSSQYYTAPRQIMVGPEVGRLRLDFRPTEPGIYPCTVKLTSDDDVRIYQIEGRSVS